MKNNITTLLARPHAKTLLMAHFVAGYPTKKDSFKIAKALIDNGAGLLEIQIPFSDPMADGPTITQACSQALAQNIKVKDVLGMAKSLSKVSTIPLVLMSYANIVFNYGIVRFIKNAVLMYGTINIDSKQITPHKSMSSAFFLAIAKEKG